MRSLSFLLALFLFLPLLNEAQDTLYYPTDVVFNETLEVYYVSNWANGDGYVVIVNTSGEILGTLFSGINYGGGLCLIGGVLFVVDNGDLYGGSLPSYIVAVDITSGSELYRVEIASEGAYLDLIATDNNGHIFICDSENFKIYKYYLDSQNIETFVEGIQKPLGICYDYIEDRIIFTESKSAGSKLKAIHPDGGEVTNEYWHPGWIEGLTMNDEGEYFISSWSGTGGTWGNEPVYKLNHDLDWKYELMNDQNRPFGMCMGHDNFLVICNWGGHSLNFFDLTPYGTDELVIGNGQLKVYPNPGNGFIHLKLPAVNLKGAFVSVTDLNGQIVHSMQLQNEGPNEEIQLDLTFLTPGMYIVMVQNGSDLFREKLVVR